MSLETKPRLRVLVVDDEQQLTDLLRDMQDRQRVRGAPPRWWNYVDVVAPPREVPHFRWQLHLDHRDTQRVVEFDEPVDREFNGLGEFVE